jgi:hypothetical protein
MRLDTLGKPPLLQNENFEKVGVLKIKKEDVGAVFHSESSDNSTSSNDGQERFAKILNILEKSKRTKIRDASYQKQTEMPKVLQVYLKRFAPTKGQNLDVKV